MKAVVLEVHRHECAVMKEDGTFARIPGRYQVGQTIELSDRKEPILGTGSIVRIILVSAALLTSFIGIREYYNTMMPAGYVSFDTDGGVAPVPSHEENVSASPSPTLTPVTTVAQGGKSSENAENAKDQAVSIEYTLNRRNQVIKVVAVNAQAQPTVEKLEAKDARSRSISDEIARTTNILKESGDIFEDETNYVLVSVTGSEEASEVVTRAISEAIDGKDNVELHWVDSTQKDRDEARKLGISTGRYAEIQQITKKTEETGSDDSMLTPALIKTDIDQYKTKTVKELLIDANAIDANGTSIAKAQDPSTSSGAGENRKNPSSSQNSASSDAETKKAKPTSPIEIGGNDDDNNGTGNGWGGTGNGTSGTNSTGNGTGNGSNGANSAGSGTNGTGSGTNGANGSGKNTNGNGSNGTGNSNGSGSNTKGTGSGSTGSTTPAPQTGGNTESNVLHPSTEEIGGGTEEIIAPTAEPTSGVSGTMSTEEGEATTGTASTEADASTVESAQN